MKLFRQELFTLIKNPQYQYFKVFIDGKCQFDEFCQAVEQDGNDKKWLKSVYTYMEMLSDGTMLPKEKFNHIKGLGRNDVYEFKKKSLRVYVVKKRPNVFIILGGYKGSQKEDIARLKTILKEFKTEKS